MDMFNTKKLNQKILDKIELTKIILWSSNPNIRSSKLNQTYQYRLLCKDSSIFVDEDAIVLLDDIGIAFERIELKNYFETLRRGGHSLTIDVTTGDTVVY